MSTTNVLDQLMEMGAIIGDRISSSSKTRMDAMMDVVRDMEQAMNKGKSVAQEADVDAAFRASPGYAHLEKINASKHDYNTMDRVLLGTQPESLGEAMKKRFPDAKTCAPSKNPVWHMSIPPFFFHDAKAYEKHGATPMMWATVPAQAVGMEISLLFPKRADADRLAERVFALGRHVPAPLYADGWLRHTAVRQLDEEFEFHALITVEQWLFHRTGIEEALLG